ncbi:zn 2cys6 transcription factor [Fusarium albosuccineum]|uniref:Zn 2cys6 transcription factor n=1 Tax=Fusarium albosuccineum TaxID=1237068 RepID=A0A8H4LEX2_9HYPO|nr:zn 2cys6 transcription factor [Fusarium albosuccineum]
MAHDRLAYPVSHTGISYNPVYVDWDFLVLLDVDDPELYGTERSENPTVTPLISGIIAVIKLYLCAVEIRPDKLPGNPRYGRFSPTQSFRPVSFTPSPCSADTSKSPGAHGLTLEQGLNVVQALRNVISQLPGELKLFDEDGYPITGLLPFAIARANAYMTSLFIQSIILATLSANDQSFQQPNAPHSRMEPQDAIQSQEGKHVNRRLLDLRKDIAQESFHVVVATPISALKANGIAVVGYPQRL